MLQPAFLYNNFRASSLTAAWLLLQTQLMQHSHAGANASTNVLAQTLVPHAFQHPVPHLPHAHAHNVSAHSTNPATVDSVNDLVLGGKVTGLSCPGTAFKKLHVT